MQLTKFYYSIVQLRAFELQQGQEILSSQYLFRLAWGPPTLLYNWYWLFPQGKAAEA